MVTVIPAWLTNRLPIPLHRELQTVTLTIVSENSVANRQW